MDSECCQKRLYISNTINAAPGARTQRAVCSSCGKVYTLVTLAKAEVGYGKGAAAEAARLRKVFEAKQGTKQ